MPHAHEMLADIYSSAILIVDDDAVSRHFVEKALKSRGFSKLYCVESGEKALEHIKRFPPELIVLDVHMEGLDGLDCCRWIRAQPHLKALPVLMLTSLKDEKLRFKSFEAGATDFVSKPIHPEELNARVKVHLENCLSFKGLQRYKNRIDLELDSARELQLAILPSEEEKRDVYKRCKLEIASYLKSSSEIGGDFWGIKSLSPHQTALWMADFSGHGVAAALNAFRLQAYLKEHSALATRPGEYLSFLNEKLLHLLPRGHFATMFYGVIDTRGNQLHYACACNPHPLVLRKNGTVEKLDGTGTPLGVHSQLYENQQIDFSAEDTVCLYSDAIIETPDANNAYITEEQLMATLSAHAGATAAELKDAVLSQFTRHCTTPAGDDVTLLLMQKKH